MHTYKYRSLTMALVIGIRATTGCDGVVSTPDGRGGGAATVTASESCAGCHVDDECVEPSWQSCGIDGEACRACPNPTGPCRVPVCLDGECAELVAPDNTPCGADGICTAGMCL